MQNRAFRCSYSIPPKVSTRNIMCYIFVATKECVQKSHILAFLTIAITPTGLQDPLPHSSPMNLTLRTTTDHYRSCVAQRQALQQQSTTSSHVSFHTKYNAIICSVFCRKMHQKIQRENWRKKNCESKK